MRFNLSFFSKGVREEIYRQVVLKCETKLDIWLYSRMKNKMEHGQKLDVKELIDEVVRVFKLKKDKKFLDALKQRIIKIRCRLYYERRKQRKEKFLITKTK